MIKTEDKIVGQTIESTMVNAVVNQNKLKDMSALAERIPESERAIEEKTVYPVIGPVNNILTKSIPEDERAIEDNEQEDAISTDIVRAEERGCFSVANKMAQICNVLDGRLFASLHVDANGNRNITFCERYNSGKFSPKMQISQGELLLLANCNMDPKLISVANLKAKATRILTDLTIDYFNKFDGEEPMRMTDILRALSQVRASLPVYRDATAPETAQELYKKVVISLEGQFQLRDCEWIHNHKSYYSLNDDAMEILATDLDMKPLELANKLRENDLLYLTKSSSMYKTKVRITREVVTMDDIGVKRTEAYPTETTAEWCYCIYKVKNLGM